MITKTGDVGEILVENTPKKVFVREVTRVVKKLPKFKLGMQGGGFVSTWYRIPFTFAKMSSKDSLPKHNGVYIIFLKCNNFFQK